jgi:RHS repeat-associated protein
MLHILQSTFLRKTLLLTMIMVTVQLARAQHAVLHQSVGIVSDSAMSKLQGSGLTHTNSSQMLAAAPIFTVTPTLQRNYSSVRTFKKSGIKTATQVNQVGLTAAEVNESIAYTDGLGRGIQSVVVQGSPSGKDIIQAAEYDHAGRQARQYLPYTSSGTPGSFRALSLAGSNGYSNSEQYTFYQQSNQNYKTTAYPYAETVLEPTVFNRQEQGAPGAAWQPVNASIPTSGHTDKVDTDLSSSADAIKKWKITGNTILVDNSGFLVGLIKQSQKDANWTAGKAGTKETFTDLGGRVIAEKNYFSETAASVTYYVYDENITSRLRYVLAASIVSNTFKEGDTTFNRHVYAYHYNDMGLVVESKFPGKGWSYVVYNKKGQPVLTQDSVQRTRQEWNFVKYDAFGRIIFSGRYQNAGTRGTVQTLVDAVNVLWEKRDKATANGYTNVAFPLASQIAEVYTTNYYDDYDLPTSCPFKIMPTGCSPIADGLQTATLVKVLGGTTNLWTVSYYDQEGLPTFVKSQNNLGGTDELVSTYLFSGEVESVQRTSIASGVTTTVKESYEYDHMGRLLTTRQKINNQSEIILSSLVYNELGQLTAKKLHSIDGGVNFLQTIAYRFNERGWTTAINDANIASTGNTKFGLELKYEDALKKQYNGNIGQSKWKVARIAASPQMSYDFEYDKVNRLVGAVSSTGGAKNGNYNEYVRYDQLGNIVSLGRNALVSGAKQQIDSLKYTYDYNRHVRIDDISTSAAAAKNLGFKELKQQAIEYVYDGDGRVISDANSGTTISYNVVNMPSEIKFGTTSTINYTYNVLGEKLEKKFTSGSSVIKTAYNAGIQYTGLNTSPLQLQFIQTSEGRARYNGSVFIYEYDLTDHLGNVRATITADPADITQRTAKVIQENSYYPFGMVMPGADLAFVSGDKNNYLYNGKELQEELGQYDYGARFYDPAIGRWNVPDPLAENHYDLSPYHYVMGNPMLYIDPLGLDTAQVYGYIYNGDGLFKAQSAYEFLKNKAKRDSDFSEAFNSINSNGSNKRPLTPEELLAKRKAEEDRLRRIEYDAKRHNYGKGQTDLHDYSQTGRKISGGVLAVSKPLNDAFNNATKYSSAKPGQMTLVTFQKKVLGIKIHQPLFEMEVTKAGKWGTGLKVGSKAIGYGSILLAGRDMQVNGFTTSNMLDATMSGLAVSGYGTGVAAGYFLLNSGSILYDGKDIGQRYDELVNKYR